MRFDVAGGRSWEASNQAWREALSLVDQTIGVYTFAGAAHALWEISSGLSRSFPHRKSVAYWRDEGSLFEDVARQLSSDGLAARALESAEMLAPPPEWIEPAKKELLLMLDSTDDAISGEALAAPALDSALKDARMFRLRVSRAPIAQGAAPGPFEARVLSVAPDLAVAICGARVRFEVAVAHRMQWPERKPNLALAATESESASKALQAFALPMGARVVPPSPLHAGPARDRILFWFDDVDGSSVLEEAGCSLPTPGFASDFEAGSACRWGGPRALERFCAARGLDAKASRGLIALSPGVANAETRAALEAARERVLKRQRGD